MREMENEKKVKVWPLVGFLDQTERGDRGYKYHQPQAFFPPTLESRAKEKKRSDYEKEEGPQGMSLDSTLDKPPLLTPSPIKS